MRRIVFVRPAGILRSDLERLVRNLVDLAPVIAEGKYSPRITFTEIILESESEKKTVTVQVFGCTSNQYPETYETYDDALLACTGCCLKESNGGICKGPRSYKAVREVVSDEN